jgi:hypothetical protein
MPEAHSPEAAPRVLNASTSWILERTVALYSAMPGGNPVQVGSGVLLQIAEETFVLSASHVLERLAEGAKFVAAMSEGSSLLHVPVPTRRTADQETLDIGFFSLPSDVARELSRFGKHFVRLSELNLTDAPGWAFLSVVGFPLETNFTKHDEKKIEVGPFIYGSYLSKQENPSPRTSIMLDCTSLTIKRRGEDARIPTLQGISGCGIWRLYGNGDRLGRLDTWDPSWIQLIGIEHRVVPRRWIKGTLIWRLLRLIADANPQLHASIELIIPKSEPVFEPG